jgi:hypothetical protein
MYKILWSLGLLKTRRLAYLKINFGYLPSNITRLQEKGVSFENPIDLFGRTVNALENVVDDIGNLATSKMERVLKTQVVRLCVNGRRV